MKIKGNGSACRSHLDCPRRIEIVPYSRPHVQPVLIAIAIASAIPGAGEAQAQGKLEASYVVSLAGIAVGKGRWTIDIGENKYVATANGATAGLLRVFASGEGTSSARGAMINGMPSSTNFAATVTLDKYTEEFRMVLEGGVVKEASISPQPPPNPDRVPVTEAHRQGVADPMTASFIRIPGNANLTGPEACQRTLSVFDGRARYDLQLTYKRVDQVSSDKGYSGSAAVCGISFVPIAGFNPTRAAIKYLINMRDMELSLVPIAGTRVVVPYRVLVPTPIGPGVLQATEFVSVAQPPRATAATSKAQ